MDSIVAWYQSTIGNFIPAEVFCFFVSMLPVIELRGGIVIARLLEIPWIKAMIICVIGNIIPIPFILLLIKKIFNLLKVIKPFRVIIEKLEQRALGKSESLKKGELIGLMLFVGIPLPGTGAWTGCLAATLLDMDKKKSAIAATLGVIIAALIMSIVSYVIPALF